MVELITIRHPKCHAVVSVQGAQLLEWTPATFDVSVLWCTASDHFVKGKPIRGGVPICWPWFGKFKSPAHGFARIAQWQLVEQSESEQGVLLVFELQDSEWSRSIWPHAFKLRMTMQLGGSCKLQLSVDCNQPTTGALHGYVHLADVKKAKVTGLGLLYTDLLTGMHSVIAEDDSLVPDGAMDRVYTTPADLTVIDEQGYDRQLRLSHSGHSDIVVWNPGSESMRLMQDMQENDYRRMLCIETACVTGLLKKSLGVELAVF